MKEIKGLRTYLIQSISKPTLVSSGTNDDFQTEFAIVEKEIEKAVKPRKQYNKDIHDVIKKEVD